MENELRILLKNIIFKIGKIITQCLSVYETEDNISIRGAKIPMNLIR